MKLTFVLLLATLLTNNTHQQCLTSDDKKIYDDISRLGWDWDRRDFSITLLKTINQLMPRKNILFSPYTIHSALMVTYFLSGNKTEKHLKKILRLPPRESKIDIYNEYKLDKDQMEIALKYHSSEYIDVNKIFVSEPSAIRDCILKYFQPEAEELHKSPFASSDPERVRCAINKWMDNFSHHRIEELLPRGSIHSTTNFLLANAAYFTGIWRNKFDPNYTKQKIFYVNSSKQIMVDMMHVESTFISYGFETLESHVLELPYEDFVTMYILLPFSRRDDAIDNIIKKLTLDSFKTVVMWHPYSHVTAARVSLPKFSLEHTIDLQPIFESLGVGDLFKSNTDSAKVSHNAQHISIDKAIHKAKIVISDGTEETVSMMNEENVYGAHINCNRPFIFFIFDKLRDTILLAGVYRKPDTVQ